MQRARSIRACCTFEHREDDRLFLGDVCRQERVEAVELAREPPAIIHPGDAVSLTHSGAGVVACTAAGMPVIGIASGDDAERLRNFGANQVVPSLSSLLPPGLRAAA